jgi:hypothetical protein
MIRRKAGVKGGWRDNRHTPITELAESGAGDETVMDIVRHVSRQMLSRYSHIRRETKRKGAPVANVTQTLPIQERQEAPAAG